MVIPNYMGHLASGMYSRVARHPDSSLYDARAGSQATYPAQHPLPPEHPPFHGKPYLAFVYNPASGELKQESSPDFAHFSHTLLNDMLVELRKCIENTEPSNAARESTSLLQVGSGTGQLDQGDLYGDAMLLDDTAKRARSETIPLESNRREKPRSSQRRKVETKIITPHDDLSITNSCPTSATEQHNFVREEMVTFKVSEKTEWEKWFCDAFRALQQLGCRTMAKEWIKIIHPKKQSTNPYNGKKLKQGTGNPESTKPAYWPKDVVHREPDHINKEDRTSLLLHLLMGTPHKVMCPRGGARREKEIKAAELMAALEGKYADKKYGLQGRRALVETIMHVRTSLEDFEEGGLRDGIELTVVNYANFRKPHSTDDSDTIDTTGETLELTPQPEDYNDGDTMVLTPSSNHDSPMTIEMPVPAEISQKLSKKIGVRKKTKKRSRPYDDSLHNVSFSGSTSTVGSHRMLSTSFGMEQMTPFANPTDNQTPDFPPAAWNPNIPPSSSALVQYPYAPFEPPDPRAAHMPGQYPTKDFIQVPMPHAHFPNISNYYPPPPYLNMPYAGDSNPEGFPQPPYDYFA